ncbi:CBS domain-containing protein [Streptomyces sp. NPDC002144]
MRHGIRHGGAKSRARTAGELMSKPAVTVHTDATATEAARVMMRHGVERLPVVDEEDRLVGIVTRHDLLRVFLRSDDAIRREVRQEVLVNALRPHIVQVGVRDGVVALRDRLERRSDKSVALSLTRRLDGVAVVDRLTYRYDDTRHQPAAQAVHGVSEDWLRKL